MAKINFGRVEERLVNGLRKMFVHQLEERLSGNSTDLPEEESDKGLAGEIKEQTLEEIHVDLKLLHEHTDELHHHLKITEEELKLLVDEPTNLSPENWDRLADLKKTIQHKYLELKDQLKDPEADEKLVGNERQVHRYKRFNVRSGWVPLDTHAPPIPKKKRRPGSWDTEED